MTPTTGYVIAMTLILSVDRSSLDVPRYLLFLLWFILIVDTFTEGLRRARKADAERRRSA